MAMERPAKMVEETKKTMPSFTKAEIPAQGKAISTMMAAAASFTATDSTDGISGKKMRQEQAAPKSAPSTVRQRRWGRRLNRAVALSSRKSIKRFSASKTSMYMTGIPPVLLSARCPISNYSRGKRRIMPNEDGFHFFYRWT